MTKTIVTLLGLIIIIGGVYYFFIRDTGPENPAPEDTRTVGSVQDLPTVDEEPPAPIVPPELPKDDPTTVIGTSVENRDIIAYHYGTGDTELLFVGGIHGGYEWNTVLVAYELMDYLKEKPDAIPDNLKVTVIPVLNPDGLHKVVGTADRFMKTAVPASAEATIPGRFNANNIDLNRNFDCDWQTTGTWQSTSVDGGTEPFSEPESQALKLYVEARDLAAVVAWYSSANGVFSSNCHNGVLPETTTITNLYAQASGYPAYEDFDFYKITGDMVNWLAKKNIPAISVLLSTHEDVEWGKNKEGVDALLNHYAE